MGAFESLAHAWSAWPGPVLEVERPGNEKRGQRRAIFGLWGLFWGVKPPFLSAWPNFPGPGWPIEALGTNRWGRKTLKYNGIWNFLEICADTSCPITGQLSHAR